MESLAVFWDELSAVWVHGFMGIDVGRIFLAVLVLGVALMVRGVFARYVLARLHGWAEKTTNEMDDKVIDALIPPVRFIPLLLGVFCAFRVLELEGDLADFASRLTRSLMAFTIFWALSRALEPLSHMFKALERVLTPVMVSWIFKALRFLVIFVGAAVILEMWGIKVGPLLAGLGLLGAAVALGAQDMFRNLLAGVTIIAEKRFQPGDWIKVDGVVEGTVESIGFRSTAIRRFDKAPVQVPNGQLSDSAVTNFSRMTHRRIYWTIGVVYSTTTQQLRTIRDEILAYLESNEAFDTSPAVSTFVRVDSFNDSSIDFMIYCFTKTTNWGEWLEIKEAFALAIKEIVEEKAGTSFAFPSQSLYIEHVPEIRHVA